MDKTSRTTPQATQPVQGYALIRKSVGEIRGRFFVPRYQRGYRWDPSDVTRLLDDVWNSSGQEYSLQPVVLKLHEKGEEEIQHEWELIDGQQRLTTLYLILHYMQRQGWKKSGAPYSLRYETRPGSQAYLSTLGEPAQSESLYKTNIDYYHLYQAYQCIGTWFQKHGDAYAQEHTASRFHSHLFDNVRVIWYEAPAAAHVNDNENDSIALFTRLNVGRIALTDAELVKALLLSTVRKWQAERAQEVAGQWDGIERDLHNPDIWTFVAGENTGADTDRYATRISLLLDSLADAKKPLQPWVKRPRYHTFETLREQIGQTKEEALAFWNLVVELHARILGWFGTPGLYNKIGFLVAAGKPSERTFGALVDVAKGEKKSVFEASLVARIRDTINLNPSQLLELSYEDRKNGYPKLMQVLLLMNVETVSRTGQRFPFRRHLGKTWSLEHIHAQNAQSLTKVEQWKTWLEAHKAALGAFPEQDAIKAALTDDIEAALGTIDTATNFGPTFQRLAERVVAVFDGPATSTTGSDRDLHSISNLALLSRDDNSALSNAVFEVKRQIVLEIDRNLDGKDDGYIPVCTRNVFLKYYPGADALQVHFWSLQDRESYYNAIVSTLTKYLKP